MTPARSMGQPDPRTSIFEKANEQEQVNAI
jgi:hypothetical protein